MKTYTVVGYYPDNGQSFLDHTEAMPLVAAMRCYVASEQGGEVDIPEELI